MWGSFSCSKVALAGAITPPGGSPSIVGSTSTAGEVKKMSGEIKIFGRRVLRVVSVLEIGRGDTGSTPRVSHAVRGGGRDATRIDYLLVCT